MDARQKVCLGHHDGPKEGDAHGDRDPLARRYEASSKPRIGISDLRGGDDGGRDNGGDVTQEADEKRPGAEKGTEGNAE